MTCEKICFFIFLFFSLFGCARQAPIQTLENIPVSYNVPILAVENAILDAGHDRGWLMTLSRSGVIEGLLLVRSHEVLIEITYDAKEYSIKYLNSKNLNDKNGLIHPKYNSWTQDLRMDIHRKLTQFTMKNKAKSLALSPR